MIADELLVDLLASNDLSQQDKVLLILAYGNGTPQNLAAIREVSINHGLRRIEGWNLPRILGDAQGLAVKFPKGWKLTGHGKDHVKTKFLPHDPTSTKEIAISLRSHLDNISSPYTRSFVEETIYCLEADLKRSAVIMSWAGAMSVLYEHVVSDGKRLSDFNKRAAFVKNGWKTAVTKDDLMLMQESQFLDILAHLSIVEPGTKKRLVNFCLDLRNTCAHPSSTVIGKHTVEAHIEFLILNVYEKF